MKTDDQVTERLRRASTTVRPPDDPLERLYRRRSARRRRERLTAGGVALVLVVAVVGGSLFALRGTGHRRPVVPAAGLDLKLGAGQYFFQRMTIVVPDMDGMQGGTVEIDSWWATDGSGRRNGTDGGASYGLPELGTWGPGEFPVVDDISGLSLDPATLYGQLVDRSSPSGASPQPAVTPTGSDQAEQTGGLWRAVKALLEFPHATPEFRAALLQAAEMIPGVHRVENVTDPVGRSGYGLTLDIEGASDEIDVDPISLQPMALTETYQGDSPLYEIWEEGIVDSTDGPPVGDQLLTPVPVGPMPTPGKRDVGATAAPASAPTP
jgi:hypothetical protein